MDKMVLHEFSLVQGGAFGGLAGSIVGVLSIPFKPEFLPLTALVATAVGMALGVPLSAIKWHRAHA